ncbi:TPA: glycoside hydrolase family 28 protein [Citrobacter freundii]
MELSLKHVSLDRSGKTVLTARLQQIIDEIDLAGGGKLIFTPGIYCTGTLVLPSNFTLHLEAGACLRASGDPADFRHIKTVTVAERSPRALIYALSQQHIAFSGEGRIDGGGESGFLPDADTQGYCQPKAQRPRLLVLEDCGQVRIRDITLGDSPMAGVHLVSCNHVFINSLTIENDLALANSDALDIDSCQNVHISDSYFSTADNGISLNTTRKPAALQQPLRNVVVSNCLIRAKNCAINVGSESFADIENVTVANCVLFESHRGIGVISRDGGHVQQLMFSNIQLVCQHDPNRRPVLISVRQRVPGRKPGAIEHVVFNNLSGYVGEAIKLYNETPGQIRDVTFNGLFLQQCLSDTASLADQ